MAEVRLEHVTKRFSEGVAALDDLTLEVADGEFLILVGPSGCGKTTALRLVAGLEKPTSGTIAIGGRIVNDVTPRDRDIAMVFQNYALYPHMTVYKNLAFGLKERHTPKPEIERRVREASAILGLDDLLRRRPAQLSGGQRQRVAMGRALVREPKAFLLDEPLSNLDAKLRVQMRAELKRIHQRLGITTIYVTHDQVEAMTLGDRIVVMSNGRVQQIGRPQEVYGRPANLFVAGFIGSPPMNLLRGRGAGGRVEAGELAFANAAEGDVAVGVRPEDLRSAADGMPSFVFDVDVVEPLGNEVVVHGSVDGTLVETGAEETEIPLLLEGQRAPVTAIFEPEDEPKPGDRIRLGILPERVHLFDLRTGDAIRA
ncbi:MAG: sn-glycerol-3-phosphate ABC transporter ATP-binding protein UgpC [Actinomycetota bacterium]|nr:sn-glycerol-3-phosphate ABC transporter ATP-binding protein UgpC [Actinomycetota bacterium]